MQKLPGLYITSSNGRNRGVFTSVDIPRGSLIEVCPVIVLEEVARPLLDQTRLHDYYFIWGDKDDQYAIVLGYGSLYNHHYAPNTEYRPDYPARQLCFYALEDITAGNEITVNYSGDPAGARRVWFEVK